MGWNSSNRKSRLPSDWSARRARVGRRDSWCCQAELASGFQCLEPGNQIDHINRFGGDDDENLQVLCEYHHKIKSSQEGVQARTERVVKAKQRLARDKEKAPWELPEGHVRKPNRRGY